MDRKQNISLIDDIRRDALILMEQDPSKDYKTASEEARRNIIGDEKITTVQIKPFTVRISEELSQKKNQDNSNESTADLYLEDLKSQLKDVINVEQFDKEQLRQLSIGKRMNIKDEQIKQIADNKYSAEQIRFLCVMIIAGKDISKYLNNYEFDTIEAFNDMASAIK